MDYGLYVLGLDADAGWLASRNCSIASNVEGAREEEALAVVAVFALQVLELGLVLDALGEGLDVERLAELHEGVDEGRRSHRCRDAGR